MKFVQGSSLKTGILALTFAVIASTGGLLASCSTTAQNQASNTGATDVGSTTSLTQNQFPTTTRVTGGMQGMDHGSMNHSMAMDLGPADANYDLRFIDAMIPHHQGAVEMAKQAQQKSQRPEIKKLANDIIQAQNKEIAALKQWRQAWYPQASSTPMMHDAKTGQMMPMSQQQMQSMMMNMDLGDADAQFDLRFMNAMIPHHESAIAMATDALSKSKRPEIKKLAQDIITSQQAEIEQMKQWRQAWYKQ